jgi:hypothetical protein
MATFLLPYDGISLAGAVAAAVGIAYQRRAADGGDRP